jgi:hypothetical protein
MQMSEIVNRPRRQKFLQRYQSQRGMLSAPDQIFGREV